jgi:broad specificity phosphatase PhoE
MGRVLLVRHGQASFGADDYDVLSPTGWEQGRLLGAWFAAHDITPTALVRGGMRRHRETLEAMAATAGWSLDQTVVDTDWDEFDHVAIVAGWADLPSDVPPDEIDRRAFQKIFEAATASWTAGEGQHAETWVGFIARIRAALDRTAAAAGPGQTVVVVTSGGVIGVLAAILADPDDDDPAALARRWTRANAVMVNASVTRLLVGSTGARVLTLNEHTHLEGDTITYR